MSTVILRHGLIHRTLSTTVSGRVFADHGSAGFLGAAGGVESIPALSGLPEVVVTGEPVASCLRRAPDKPDLGSYVGRANAGKSTLLNAVLGRTNLVYTSKQPVSVPAIYHARCVAAHGATGPHADAEFLPRRR